MSDAATTSYLDETGGPLGQIQDRKAAGEIQKLWNVLQGRLNPERSDAPHKLITKADLDSRLLNLQDQIDKPTVINGGSVSTGGGVGGAVSDNLLPKNNVWTGTNTWQLGETPGTNNYQFLGLTSGIITDFTTPVTSILLPSTGFQALIDIQKSSESSVFHDTIAGNAAIYVQHRSGGGLLTAPLNVNTGNWAIKAVAEGITAVMPGYGNGIAAVYAQMQNAGLNSAGWAVRAEATHKSSISSGGDTATYGVESTVYRYNLDGKTAAFHARSGALGGATANNDYALLISPQSSGVSTGFKTLIAGGSDFVGSIHCNIGLDLSHAFCDVAAIMMAPNQRFQMNGPNTNLGFYFHPRGVIQFFSDIGDTVAIGNDGVVYARGFSQNVGGPSGGGGAVNATSITCQGTMSAGYISITTDATQADVGSLFGYLRIDIGGFTRLVPFYGMP